MISQIEPNAPAAADAMQAIERSATKYSQACDALRAKMEIRSGLKSAPVPARPALPPAAGQLALL